MGQPLFFTNKQRYLKDITQSNLNLPDLAQVGIVAVSGGRIDRITFAVAYFNHGKLGYVVYIAAFIMQDATVVTYCHILIDTPLRVQHVTEIQHIYAGLKGVLTPTCLNRKILHNPQVELIHPGRSGSISFGIASFVLTQIIILLHKGEESILILLRNKANIATVFGNINKISWKPIIIHVVIVGEGITIRRVAGIEKTEGGSHMTICIGQTVRG